MAENTIPEGFGEASFDPETFTKGNASERFAGETMRVLALVAKQEAYGGTGANAAKERVYLSLVLGLKSDLTQQAEERYTAGDPEFNRVADGGNKLLVKGNKISGKSQAAKLFAAFKASGFIANGAALDQFVGQDFKVAAAKFPAGDNKETDKLVPVQHVGSGPERAPITAGQRKANADAAPSSVPPPTQPAAASSEVLDRLRAAILGVVVQSPGVAIPAGTMLGKIQDQFAPTERVAVASSIFNAAFAQSIPGVKADGSSFTLAG
jgi:hypothetical protein